MKCRKCGGQAVLELRRHNAAFCVDDFVEFFRNQVREAIHRYRMLERGDKVLVAVSGGKDSLGLWDVLLDEGYTTTGLYLDLGIFEYSVESKSKCEPQEGEATNWEKGASTSDGGSVTGGSDCPVASRIAMIGSK